MVVQAHGGNPRRLRLPLRRRRRGLRDRNRPDRARRLHLHGLRQDGLQQRRRAGRDVVPYRRGHPHRRHRYAELGHPHPGQPHRGLVLQARHARRGLHLHDQDHHPDHGEPDRLAENSGYTYAAYNDSACSHEIARESFTTRGLWASDVDATTLTLNIGGHTGSWYYKANKAPDTSCQPVAAGTSKGLTGLAADTGYVYTAHSDVSCSAAKLLATGAFRSAVTVSNLSRIPLLRSTQTIERLQPQGCDLRVHRRRASLDGVHAAAVITIDVHVGHRLRRET